MCVYIFLQGLRFGIQGSGWEIENLSDRDYPGIILPYSLLATSSLCLLRSTFSLSIEHAATVLKSCFCSYLRLKVRGFLARNGSFSKVSP